MENIFFDEHYRNAIEKIKNSDGVDVLLSQVEAARLLGSKSKRTTGFMKRRHLKGLKKVDGGKVLYSDLQSFLNEKKS